MSRLKRIRMEGEENVLSLKISGDDFHAQLARAKAVPGRRYNGADKTWEFPDTAESLLRLVHTVEPDLAKDLAEEVSAARAEQAEEVVTKLADDAACAVPWQGRLAPKQRAGIDFMARHPHCLLADDMGSGKTVQSISTIFEYEIRAGDRDPGNGPYLIIAPNSVTSHWKRELRKWANIPEGCVHIIEGDKARREAELKKALEGGRVKWFIINWEKLQSRLGLVGTSKKPGILDKVKWKAVIADEVHRAKNRKAQQGKGLRRLRAPLQIGVTGTPVQNNPGELFNLLQWLAPETYTSYWAFFHTYTEFYEGYKGKPVVIGVKNADGLRFELADKMVRRTKREIHPDMHEPFDPITYEPDMTKDQQKLYNEVEKQFWVDLAEEAVEHGKGEELKTAAASGELSFERVRLMVPNAAARVLRLRQVATSPAVLEVEGESPPDSSGKLDDIVRVVGDAGPRPWVFFTWFKRSAALVAERLAPLGEAHVFTGDTTTGARAELARSFQAGEFPFIVCTIKAGGTGIDLYHAADCGFVEEDWVPTENSQAFGRVDRKGQTQRPQRHNWRSKNSVDTGNIAPTNATKQLIIDTIVG